MVEKSLIELPEVFLNQAFRLYNRLGFKLDQHHLNRGYPGPLHFLLEAQKPKQSGRKQVENGYAEDTLALIESIVPYTTEMGDGRWKSVDTFAKELVMSLLSNEQFDKFYVVHGAAGTGKSVYLATLFEAIKNVMCSNHKLNPLDEINRFSLPLFHSNLKHVSGYGELDAKLVLDGIGADLFPTQEIWSPTKLAEMADIPQTHTGLPRGIILIDSLDEYITNTAKSSTMTYDSIRESLFNTHADFVDAGFIPVWSCRTREYHLLEMEETQWKVKASTPPALATTNLAEYCFCEKENEGILGEIRRYSDPNTRENSEVSALLGWLLKIASVNPLFFFFKTFTENRDEAKKLMHALIHRMQEAFEDVEQHILYDEESVMELQNRFVLSDFVVQTMLEHLYSTYTSDRYNLKNQMQEVIQALQSWVDNWGGAREENLEDLTEVWNSLDKPNQIEGIVDFRLLEYYGLIAKTEANKWIWRHRSFAEYLCVSDSLGAYTRGERIDEIEENWEEQDFNRSVWRWRKWSANWGASGTIIRDRTGAYATFFPSEMFSLVPTYLDLFLDTDDQIDRQRLAEGEFGFSQTQFDIIQRGVERNEAIVLKGWPGTGKTYTGTHMLLGRLVNAHLRSGRAEYDSEQASKGLIITLNPKLSVYLREELDQYEKGPWSVLARERLAWSELKKSVDVLSMEEIVARLDNFESSNVRSRVIYLKDLKDLHDNHWTRFVRSCKTLPEWEYDPTYDWKKASREFQECFMDEMGDFYPTYDSVSPIYGGKVSEQWFEYVRSIAFGPNKLSDIHPIPLKTACIKLVHRFIQAFDYHGPTENLPDTKLRDADHRTNEEILASLRSNPLVSDFSNALIDEVQDLPVEACLLISLLVHKGAGNQRSRVLFAGDEFQVLNQSNFEWSQFGRLYEQKITELQNQYNRNQINASSYLYQTAPPNVSDEPFTDNWRNTTDIVETWKKAGSWSPEGLKITPLEGIENARCIRTEEDDSNHSVSLITYQNTSRPEFEELIGAVDDVIKSHSGVAFISMADQLESIFREKKVEHYTPFTIKGLERNNAMVVGSLLFEKDKSFTESDVKDERMRLIVGLSRAKNSMVLLLPSNIESKKHRVRIDGKEYEQHDLSQLLGRQVRIIRANDLKEVRLEIEKIVGGDDEGRAILAIDEYLAAEAYGSDQINSIAHRVRKICEKDIHEKNELSYFWQILQQLGFSEEMNPVFLEAFILNNDPQTYLKGLPKVTLDGTSIAQTLSRYHSKWIHREENPYFNILQRHSLFTAFEGTIQEMIDLSPPVISGMEGAYDLTFNRIQSRIIDGLKHLRGQMNFHKYLWDEKDGFVKNSRQLALLHYLVKDYDEINKFNPDLTTAEMKIVNNNASNLLKMIGRVASNEYARFRTHEKKSIPELKMAIGSLLSFVKSEPKPIEDFLGDFPVGEYRNILSTQALVELIKFIIEPKHKNRRVKFKNQLSHLFIAFCSFGHQVILTTQSRREALSRKEFTLVYALLGQRERQGISSKNLNFDYAQHVLSEQFLDTGLNSSLEEYSTRLNDLFKSSVSDSTLMQPNLKGNERMPSETLMPTGAAKQSESLSKVIIQFIAKILDALDDPINGHMYNQNGTIRAALGTIASTLLKYNSDAYLRDIYIDKLSADSDFKNIIKRLRKEKKISMDEMVRELIDEMNDYLTQARDYANKHLLVRWASVRYIIDVLEYETTPEEMRELRDISRMYPFFRLDDKNERPLIAINSDGSFLIPRWDDFQQKSKQLTMEMKERRKNFTYFARSPFDDYKTTPHSYLKSPVYLEESMAEWCKISWDEYANFANTSEDVEFNGMPVLIHQNSLALLPELLSKIRKEALASIRKVKSRVFVETIVKSVRKTKLYDATVPFGRGIDSKIKNAKNSEVYKEMVREIENQVEQEIVLGTGKARKQQKADREALRAGLIKIREPKIILDELWRTGIRDVLTNSFNLKINMNPDNKTTFIDVIENEDAIEKLEKGV